VLTAVRVSRDPKTGEENLVHQIDYAGEHHSGVLREEDPKLRTELLQILTANIGRAIQEIGSLELKRSPQKS
jgi:hypothetical protein